MIRTTLALPLLLLAACSVDNDDANDQVTVAYNEDEARATAGTVADKAGEIGGHIVNDVQQAGEKVQSEVGDVDVDVDVNRNAPANSN